MTNIIEISPYVARSAEKAALIGKSADVCRESYTFARQQKLYTPPLQKSAPVTGLWNDWVRGVLISLAIACLLVWTV